MWAGVFIAAALCLALGIVINQTTGEFPQKQQELFEGIVAVVAVVILTSMVFWMRRVARNIKLELEQAVDQALQISRGRPGPVLMVFLAVAPEGLSQCSFYCRLHSGRRLCAAAGAVLGLATAVVLGMLIYWGGVRLNMAHFFRWTSLFYSSGGRGAGSWRYPCLS